MARRAECFPIRVRRESHAEQLVETLSKPRSANSVVSAISSRDSHYSKERAPPYPPCLSRSRSEVQTQSVRLNLEQHVHLVSVNSAEVQATTDLGDAAPNSIQGRMWRHVGMVIKHGAHMPVS